MSVETVYRMSKDDKSSPSSFFLRVDNKIIRIGISDILFIEGMSEYVKIITDSKKFITHLSLTRLAICLPTDRFFRVHRSYIINMEKIDFVLGNMIHLREHQIKVSKSSREPFLNRLNIIKPD